MEDKKFLSTIEETFWEVSAEFFEEEWGQVSARDNREIFTPAITAWLMIGQKIIGDNNLSSCIRLLIEGKGRSFDWLSATRKFRMQGVSKNTGGICQARQRLPEAKIIELADEIWRRLTKEEQTRRKKATYLLDGSTIVLSNTKEIKKDFVPHRNNTRECLPEARVVVAHDVDSGVALRPEIGSLVVGEQALCIPLLDRIPEGSVVIADRNFGIFFVAWNADKRGIKPLVRLQKMRAERLLGRAITEDGDWQVEWQPSRKDREGNASIEEGAAIKGRCIAITMRRRGYRPEQLLFFTTIKDASPKELLKLYGKRQLIETDLRTLKYAVKLETVSSKDPSMVRKEIILGVTAYNLVRACIAKGAIKVGLHPRDISFTRAIDLLQITASRLAYAKDEEQTAMAMRDFYKGLTQIKHPKRTRKRIEPRKVVRRLKTNFPMMKETRALERKKLFSKA